MAQMTNTLQQFMQIQTTTNNQNTQAINDLQGTINKMSTTLSTLERGKFPAQPQPNPQVVASTPENVTETDEAEKEPEVVRPELKKPVSADVETSRGLVHSEKEAECKKETFPKEQVSVLILSETPQEFGDPGSPHISIMIGESRIGRALLDLGSSVNWLPFSVYEQLRLGELKKTSIKLQLADRSVKVPGSIVENVLVQQPTTTIYQVPVILGRPFIATSNALINCQSRVLKLTFRNMTLEMNVFNTCKMPGDCNESEVHVVEVISELEEIKREAYDNSRLANERLKALHDKKIHDKHLFPDQKVLLYNSRLYLFPRKSKSRWKGPYIVKKVHPHGAVDIVNLKNGNSFTVIGQRLKSFLNVFDPHEEILLVQDFREVF
ncbi:hypothetical protein F2P56_024479 [Juglans regia]|uniref:Uncharacterized protein n=2 Tax=Juglans regia TaxID=51240 RepID=A0A833UMA9_JUGRE|nr:uncharacterized protein LOC108993611 [Juglans regia]KAF5454845.1 hypothetical protein F2P56_024479 [Juglans regia]